MVFDSARWSYDHRMTAKLSKELAADLHATGDRELEVIDPDTERTYFLVDRETHLRAMEALRRQQDRDAMATIIELGATAAPDVRVAHIRLCPGLAGRDPFRCVATLS